MNSKIIILLFIVSLTVSACGQGTPNVKTEKGADPDIVLINIGNCDRASISRIIRAVDSCQPAVIVVYAVFPRLKDPTGDSLLAQALRAAPNDILAFIINEKGETTASNALFTSEAAAAAEIDFEFTNGLVSRFTPLRKENGADKELLPLAVVKKWKPGFRYSIRPDQQLDIVYRYRASQYLTLTGDLFTDPGVEPRLLKGKVVILGFLGPGKEDLKKTPLRFLMDPEPPQNEPDTYGTVILANQVRTILDHEMK